MHTSRFSQTLPLHLAPQTAWPPASLAMPTPPLESPRGSHPSPSILAPPVSSTCQLRPLRALELLPLEGELQVIDKPVDFFLIHTGKDTEVQRDYASCLVIGKNKRDSLHTESVSFTLTFPFYCPSYKLRMLLIACNLQDSPFLRL